MWLLKHMIKYYPEIKEKEEMRKIIGRYGLTGKQQVREEPWEGPKVAQRLLPDGDRTLSSHVIQSLLHSREVTPDSLTRVDFCLPQAQAGRCTRVSECQARTLPAWGPALAWK